MDNINTLFLHSIDIINEKYNNNVIEFINNKELIKNKIIEFNYNIEDIIIIDPPPDFLISGIAYFEARKLPFAFIA